jgi:hypothetical protein
VPPAQYYLDYLAAVQDEKVVAALKASQPAAAVNL